MCRKVAPKFVGPFNVLKAVGKFKVAYRIELPSNRGIHPVFHAVASKAYNFFPGNHTLPPLPPLIDRHEEYEVDCIANTKRVRSVSAYFTGLNTTSPPGRMSKTLPTAWRSSQNTGGQRHALSSPGALSHHKTEDVEVISESIRPE